MIGMTSEEYRRQQADAMSEAQLQAAIIGTGPRAPGLAQRLGWLAYHTHRSDRSPKGFPDLVLTRRGRLVIAELKRQKRSNPTPEQVEWLDALSLVEDAVNERTQHVPDDVKLMHDNPIVEVFLWRPLDLLNGEVERILR